MGFSGPFGRLRQLQKELRDLADPRGRGQQEVARQVVREVRGVLKEQFAAGEGSDGPWARTKDGRPALVSRKLPQDFRGKPVPSGARFSSRISWLRAHHEGHTFGAQEVAANQRFLTFDRYGRLVRASR